MGVNKCQSWVWRNTSRSVHCFEIVGGVEISMLKGVTDIAACRIGVRFFVHADFAAKLSRHFIRYSPLINSQPQPHLTPDVNFLLKIL
jgi:hypothetical protein